MARPRSKPEPDGYFKGILPVHLRQRVFEELCDLVNLDDTSKDADMLRRGVGLTLGNHAAHQRWFHVKASAKQANADGESPPQVTREHPSI